MNTVTFAVVYLVGTIIYRLYDGPLPQDTNLGLMIIASWIWAFGTIFMWIARRHPLAGWALFGFLCGIFGMRGRRRW